MNRLLLDIGASSIKSAIQDDSVIDLDTFKKTESFSTKHGDRFDSDIIVSEFLLHVKKQFDKKKFQEIWLCSEMHNFTLLDIINNSYSDFFSWRYSNSRSAENKKKIIDNFYNIEMLTGQTLHSGIPILNLGESLNKNSTYKILSLPELIVNKIGISSNKIHDSMAASMGFLNIKHKVWLKELLFLTYPQAKFSLPEIFQDNESPFLGTINIDGSKIKIFGGFGDLQTALYGSEINNNQICINIGTGSQVLAICDKKFIPNHPIDMKPFFGKFIKSITHIPAGRSFNYLNENIFNDKNLWQKLSSINLDIINNKNKQNFDLNIFPTNWRYDSQNIITIKEAFNNDPNFYNLLLNNFCLEYTHALSILDKNSEYKKLLLSGGRLKDIPYVNNFFREIYGSDSISSNTHIILDETIMGLDKLSKHLYL